MIKKIYKTLNNKKIFSLIKKNKITVLTLLFVYILSDIFFTIGSSDLRIFGALFFYTVFIYLYHLKARVTFLFCLAILAVLYFEFLLTPGSPESEKAAVWLFFFLLIGVIQQWKE